MNEKSFKIGQIVYILSEKSESIIPGVIAEKIVVEKIDGNTISWKIRIGSLTKSKLYNISQINGEIYGSLDEALATLYKRLESFIISLGEETKEKVKKIYGREIELEKQKQLNISLPSTPQDKIDVESLIENMTDSPDEQSVITTTFNSIPKHQLPKKPQISKQDNYRENLMRALTDDEETSSFDDVTITENGENFVSVIDNDGKLKKVNLKV